MASPEANVPPFLEARDLGFRYPTGPDVLEGVNLRIQPGDCVGLIGPNGAGKSTLLHLLAGLLPPTRGTACLEGRPAARLDPRRRARRLALVPQASRVLFPYRSGQIVAMGRHPWRSVFGEPTPADRQQIRWAMEVTGTAGFADRLFSRLSGGEAQRVLLARALAQGTPGLLLDEPTASLDLYYQAALYGLLERLTAEHGLTVLVVTHDVNLAAEYCPRLVGLRAGRVLMDGPPEALLRPERIEALYGVAADVIESAGVRFVRVRHTPAARDSLKRRADDGDARH